MAISRSNIEYPIKYTAEDSITTDLESRILRLKGSAKVEYGEMSLEAEYIEISWKNSTLTAYGYTDSTGKMRGTPVFRDETGTYESERITFNYKTKKGIVTNFITQEGEGYIKSERVKKFSEKGFFAADAYYTTCNLSHPHFYIKSKKMKRTDRGTIVTGPFNLYLNDVPTPLGFPFGLFPVPDRRKSGIIFPTFGEQRERGFFAQGGGFYWAVGERLGLKFLTDVYSNGSFGGSASGEYVKRYRHNGNFSLTYNRNKFDQSGIEAVSQDVWLSWSHRPVTRGSSSFSANVNAGSNTYNQFNAKNINNFIAPTFNSSVNYSKTFTGTPFNLSAAMRHNQNVQTGVMNLTLPEFSFFMNRVYPFKRPGKRKAAFIEGLNLSYTTNLNNEISNQFSSFNKGFNVLNPGQDTVLPISASNLSTIFSRTNVGMKHNIPVSTTITLLKHLNLNPNFTYEEFWYPRKLSYVWDEVNDGVRIDTLTGFKRAYSYSTGVSLNTVIYGTFRFHGKRLKGIRHQMTPSINFNYRPDFSEEKYGFFQNVQINKMGDRTRLSTFEGSNIGSPAPGRSGSIGFSINNFLEAKVLDRKAADTALTEKEKYKKVRILNNLSLSGSYNFFAEQFKLSPINIAANTSIWDNRISISAGATLDPYVYQFDGILNGQILQTKLDKYAWEAGQGIGKISNANLAISGNLSPRASQSAVNNPSMAPAGTDADRLAYIRNNPDQYVDFNIPWNLTFNYNISYSKNGFQKAQIVQSLMFAGEVNLTPKWKIGFNSGYDFEAGGFTPTSFNIYRDLHCWQMSLNAWPFGSLQQYSFDLRVKASILQDLKLSKRRSQFDF